VRRDGDGQVIGAGSRRAYLERARADLRAADPVIGALIDAKPDYDPDAWLAGLPRMDAFGVLIFQVVGQQLSVRATRTILGRIADRFGGNLPAPAALLGSPPGTLRDLGLSHRKEATLRELAARFADGRLSAARLSSLSDDEVERELTAVPGVGRWTAHGFLLLALARGDVVATGDLVLRKAVQRAYRLDALPTERQMAAIAEAWRPHRSLASSYLFAMSETPRSATGPTAGR
jgi:DNA-3-methyladenine glycosylase II